MSSNLARSTSFNFFSLSEIIQESYPHLDTDCNSSCVDIFTVDTNAQMDLLGVYDVYISTRILTRVALTFLLSTTMLGCTIFVSPTYISTRIVTRVALAFLLYPDF